MPNIDMSRMHTLGDHWPFTRRCRVQFGGGRWHLKLAWSFVWRDRLAGVALRPACWLGRHNDEVWRRGAPWERDADELGAPGDYRALCRRCGRTRTATEDEWW